MKVYETAKFRKQRKRLRNDSEKLALKEAIRSISETPSGGKKLKGELKDFRSLKYVAEGRERRLIYKIEEGMIYLLSFGPREGIYK